MARRQLAKREVTDVTIPQDRTAEGLASLADTALGFAELEKRKDLANINDYLADANMQMLDATNKWRISNESDPTNQESLGKLHADYDKILSQYNEKVGLLSRGEWLRSSDRLKSQYQLDNAEWGIKQTVVNVESSTNDSIDKNLEMFRQLGRTFDTNKLKNSYQLTREALETSATGTIGKDKTDKLLKNYHRDSMKMFMYGAAESDPDKAELLLNQQDIQNDIDSPEDMTTLRSIVEKNKKLREEGLLKSQNEAEDNLLTNYLLDSSKVDILTVDKALEAKQIRPEFAKQMRNAILSSKTVRAKTDPEEYVKLVTQAKDLHKRRFFNKASFDELARFRANIISAYSDGKIEKSQMVDLLTDTKYGVDSLFIKKPNFNRALDTLKAQSSVYGLKSKRIEAQYEMWSMLMDKVRAGKDPDEAALEVSTEYIKNELSEAVKNTEAYHEKAIPKVQPKDTVKMVASDGTIGFIPKDKVAEAEKKGLKRAK